MIKSPPRFSAAHLGLCGKKYLIKSPPAALGPLENIKKGGEDPSWLSGPIAYVKKWGSSPPWLSCSPIYYYIVILSFFKHLKVSKATGLIFCQCVCHERFFSTFFHCKFFLLFVLSIFSATLWWNMSRCDWSPVWLFFAEYFNKWRN